MARVLVTGASGFIGGRVCRHLATLGDEVIAVARRGGPEADGVTSVAIDLAGSLADLPDNIDAVVHLATTNDRRAPWVDAVRVNVDATVRLAEEAKRKGARHFVLVSTTNVYQPATDTTHRLAENDERIRVPGMTYGITKAWAEDALQCMAADDFALTVLRPSVVYGPGQRASSYMSERADETVAGSQVYLAGEEGHTLTPVYVDDLVDVIAWALRETPADTFNVGGPESLSEAEIARQVAAHFHEPLAFVDRPDQAAISLAIDVTKLDNAYPDRPRRTLVEGLEATWPGGVLT